MRTLLGMVAALALVVPAFAGEKKDIVDTDSVILPPAK